LINKKLDSAGDILRLSRTNKAFFSLLIPERARLEAERVEAGCTNPAPSMLYLAIHNDWTLSEIEKIIRAYHKSGSQLLRGRRSIIFEPPLHLAVRRNRLDVVDALLAHGCPKNIRWGNQSGGCDSSPHEMCPAHKAACTNALCVARELGHHEMASWLLARGIDDLARRPTSPTDDATLPDPALALIFFPLRW
jgi:hypothetical protein